MKKIISFTTTFVMILLLTFSLFSCGEEPVTEKKSAFINGEYIGSYDIVYSEENDYELRAAEYIQGKIKERTGVKVDLVKASEDGGEGAAILVGETARELSSALDAECAGLQFAISADGTEIALEGELFVIAAAAYYFVETYVTGKSFSAIVPEETAVLEPIVKEAKNHILLIGDGMGYVHTRMFDYLADPSEISDGEDTFYGYMLPSQGSCRTSSLSGVTDSAAAGTALATGYKTYNEYIGLNKDGESVKSLTELAIELGKGAAVISTETQTGATPATFSSHVVDRGSSSEIRKQQTALITEHGVIIDGNYSQYTSWIMKSIEGDVMEAIGKMESDPDGFFMMYEEAHIDKACHSNDLERTYLSVIRFNQIIARVMEYAFYNPETFVLITADHETGDLEPNASGELVYGSEEHTDKDVPVFAYGKGSELFNGKTVENVQIAMTFASFWGVSDFGDQSEFAPLGK
ncbi:MAG: alkaline phosphatase [Clostridia bacterium]|nr:alkaline phosphatase [Clostridia bacterium]